jgi:hypothetical protein
MVSHPHTWYHITLLTNVTGWYVLHQKIVIEKTRWHSIAALEFTSDWKYSVSFSEPKFIRILKECQITTTTINLHGKMMS